MFLVVIFLIKTFQSGSWKKETYQSENKNNGLAYSDATFVDLVNKDTDGDGVMDWEEGLWSTDPTKKETTPGTPDKVAIEKIKTAQGVAVEKTDTTKDSANQNDEKLTETEKFSRELFATVAAANQNGNTMDQPTIESLSDALSAKIKNPVVRKVYLLTDIKIGASDDKQAISNYAGALINIQKIYTVNYTVLDVLQKFMVDENNVDVSVLSKLDPIINQTNQVMQAGIKMSVPPSLAVMHLNVINSLERLSENLSDIKLYGTDPILSLGAISQYNQNANTLESDVGSLESTIQQKLGN